MALSRTTGRRQWLFLTAIAVALLAQQVVFVQPNSVTGWALFALAAIVGALFDRSQLRVRDLPAPPPAPELSISKHWLWAAAAAVAAVGATVLSESDRWPVAAVSLWAFALGAAYAACSNRVISTPTRPGQPWSATEIALLGVLVVVAAAARFSWIDSLPHYYFGDEPRVGAFLTSIYRDGIPNFFTMGWNTWPMIGLSMQGLFAPVFGLSTTTLRLSSALMGTLAVPVTYLLARELYSRRLALFAAILLAVGRTAIDFSRLGVCHAQVMLLESLAFFCWWRGVNTGRATSYLLAGIALGLCLYTYNAGQLVPFIWVAWLALSAIFCPRIVIGHWRGITVVGLGFVLAAFAWLFYVSDHFTFGQNWYEYTFMARNRQVLDQVRDTWLSDGSGAAMAVLGRQTALTWLGFGVLPAEAYGLGYRGGGMLDHVSAPLFVLGLAMSLRQLRGPGGFIVLWWLATTVFGGVFTAAPPAYVRLVGILPALAILAAQPLEAIVRSFAETKRQTFVGAALVTTLLAIAAWENWRTYFLEFPRTSIDSISELGRYVQGLPATTPVFLLGAEHFLRFSHEELFPLNFPGRRLEDVADPAHFLPLHLSLDTPVALVLGPEQLTLAEYIRRLYPGAVEKDHMREDRPLFRTIELTADDLMRRAGLVLQDPSNPTAKPPTADPFAPDLGLLGRRQLMWNGSIYWPTDRPAVLRVDSSAPVTVRLAQSEPLRLQASGSQQIRLVLPRGWHPVSVEEVYTGPRTLTMWIETVESKQLLTRGDLRPESTNEGLLATYERDGETFLRAVDPQLNAFAVGALFPGAGDLVRAPFSVTWSGTLNLPVEGKYDFEIVSTGPYSVLLDGQFLCGAEHADFSADEPRSCRAARDLATGAHPIAAHWDNTGLSESTRWLFQLYWTPPGGTRELIPPSHYERGGESRGYRESKRP